MMSRRIAAGAAAAAVLVFIALKPRHSEPPAAEPYSIHDGQLAFPADSRMLKRLEVVEVAPAAEESAAYRAVGQIIALSDVSESLTENRIGWVELDPELSKSVGLSLTDGSADAPGVAFGVAAVSDEYAGRIFRGHRVEIRRYGLKKSGVEAVVSKVVERPDGGREVVFRLAKAQDWFPGTNCEVVFPVIRSRLVNIPSTAPVHERGREFVWRETGEGRFSPQAVSVIDSTPDEISVLGLNPGERIVARGAILLKPLIRPLLQTRKESDAQ